MRSSPGLRASAVFVTLALLAGCGAAGNQTLPAAAGVAPAASRAASGALLYVVDDGAATVSYYSYPKMKKAGALTGFGSVNGACVDAKSNVFIPDGGNYEVDEFAHGGTKILRKLKDFDFYLEGCAIDPVTGNLAVATQPRNSSPGGVAIFARAKGKAKNLDASGIYLPSHCAYDGNGDLFLDGQDTMGYFRLTELPAKSKTFVPIELDQSITVPGGVHWDGKYLAVGDQGAGYRGSDVYRFAISGSSGTTVSKVALLGSSEVDDFWLDGSRLIAPDHGRSASTLKIWKYPAGGYPVKAYSDGFVDPIADAVSP
jgi:hypothetical protein